MLRLVGILGVFLVVGVTALLALSIVVINLASGPDPTKDEPGAYTKAFVQDAIDRYEADGREAAIDYYSSQESVDGEWYVFIVDADGYTIAHPRAEIIGRDPSLRVDVTGYFYGDDLLSATEEGKWVNYVFLNIATGSQDTKHTWVVKHDGLLFASGWYERSYDAAPTKNEPGAYTKAFVQDAIKRYEADGREATVDYYSSQESVDGEWYVVVIDEDGRMISHPTIPENVGQDLNGPAGTDVAGNVFGPDLLNATEAGKWVSYVYLNPATGEQGEKHSWAVKHDGLVFVSGWYEG